MTSRITLPALKPGEVIVGGIVFTDGVADVPHLGPHSRRYFELTGVDIEDIPEAGTAEQQEAPPPKPRSKGTPRKRKE